MSNIIKITPDEEGRAYLKLYGEKVDVTDLADKKGRGETVVFGDTYRFQIEKPKAKQETEETTPEVEPTPEEAPAEAEEVADEN